MPMPTPPALWFLNSRLSIALARADNADGLSIIHHRMAFADAPPHHVHHDEDEVFHVLDGEITFRIAGVTTVARTGDTVLAPRAVPHGFVVSSPEGASFLTVTRGGFEDLVRDLGRPAGTAGLPPPMSPSREMQEVLAARCAAHGISILGPGLSVEAGDRGRGTGGQRS